MNAKNSHWDLEKFLQSRAFSELNPEQQNWVLQQTTEADYQDQRWTILASKDFFAQDAVPQPPSLEQVLARRRGGQKQGGFFSLFDSLTSLRVPSWQLGMAIVCGWLLGQWNAGVEKSNLGLVPQIVYQTDTIVREIPIYIGLGKQAYTAYVDSQAQKKVDNHSQPLRREHSTRTKTGASSSIAHDRELFDLAVEMH